jgi:hypothetical protein
MSGLGVRRVGIGNNIKNVGYEKADISKKSRNPR